MEGTKRFYHQKNGHETFLLNYFRGRKHFWYVFRGYETFLGIWTRIMQPAIWYLIFWKLVRKNVALILIGKKRSAWILVRKKGRVNFDQQNQVGKNFGQRRANFWSLSADVFLPIRYLKLYQLLFLSSYFFHFLFFIYRWHEHRGVGDCKVPEGS